VEGQRTIRPPDAAVRLWILDGGNIPTLDYGNDMPLPSETVDTFIWNAPSPGDYPFPNPVIPLPLTITDSWTAYYHEQGWSDYDALFVTSFDLPSGGPILTSNADYFVAMNVFMPFPGSYESWGLCESAEAGIKTDIYSDNDGHSWFLSDDPSHVRSGRLAINVWAKPLIAVSPNPLILSVGVRGTDLQISWQGAGGSNYVIQAASSLTGTNVFSDISPVIALPGSGTTVTNYIDVGALATFSSRFYRIRSN
jgi:hypothetical protein